MDTYIWNIPGRKYCTIDHGRDREEPYQHSFGGPVRHRGTAVAGVGREVHLLYNFDLSDPRLGLKVPHLRWLPVYYPFRNTGGGFCYRVVSDEEVVLLSTPWPRSAARDKHFFKDYPAPFRKRFVRLGQRVYDSRNASDVSLYACIFGLDPSLTAAQKRKLRKLLEQECYWLRNDDGSFPDRTVEELVSEVGGILTPLGFPGRSCPNSGCAYHRKFGKLTFFFLLKPDEYDGQRQEKVIYREIAGADSGQLHGLICPRCFAIAIENPCT